MAARRAIEPPTVSHYRVLALHALSGGGRPYAVVRIALSRWLPALSLAGTLLCGANSPAASGATSSYHIGNSFTFDSQPAGMAALANSMGFAHGTGHHIRCSWPLNAIAADPHDVCLAPLPFDNLANALPQFPWNAVTLQPHPKEEFASTLGSDVEAILELIDLTRSNPANANTTFYLFTAWPVAFYYDELWPKPVADDPATTTVTSRAYTRLLLERLRAETDARLGIIPVGDVLYRMGPLLESGALPGFDDRWSLYRDGAHLTLDVGRYIAAATMFSTMFGLPPHAGRKPEGFFGDVDAFSPEIYRFVHDVIWDVVSSDPAAIRMTQPTDFDRNGMASLDDLATWEAAWGHPFTGPRALRGYHGDATSDGRTTGADLLAWQRDALPRSSTAGEFTPVPEPASVAHLAILCVASRRRRNDSTPGM